LFSEYTLRGFLDSRIKIEFFLKKIPKFLEYVENIILDPVKEKVVKFWVYKAMHMGNTTTNRVESAHS